MNAPVKSGTFVPADKDLHLPTYAELSHLPGLKPHPLPLLRTIEFLKDPLAGVTANVAKFGKVYRVNNFGGWNVGLIGPDANELVLFDKDKNFSSELGWTPILGRVFPRGLMLLDFDHHRADRKTLSVAFKPEPLRHYLGALNSGIARGIAGWPTASEFKFYPAIKALTLDLAATSFLGIAWGPEADAINKAFVDMVAASIGIVRVPLPFTAMGRGVKGHRFMSKFFAREIPKRRGATGADFFTQFCNARNDAGDLLTDQEIIDHMNFLMMAAHDTLTSSLTSTIYYLAKNPEWQDRLRTEIMAVRATAGPELPFDRLGELEQTEWAFKEALRLLPPVPSVPRRALREFTFAGLTIPGGTHVGVNPMYTHRMAEYWEDPETFDPSRFSHNRSKGRHKYAWVPFGGGAHMCIGLHFAYMQMKSFLYTLLSEYRVVVADDYVCDFQMFPIPKPKDGLPIRLERL
nr:cytochrome P450 [Polymorphobacter sp.]